MVLMDVLGAAGAALCSPVCCPITRIALGDG